MSPEALDHGFGLSDELLWCCLPYHPHGHKQHSLVTRLCNFFLLSKEALPLCQLKIQVSLIKCVYMICHIGRSISSASPRINEFDIFSVTQQHVKARHFVMLGSVLLMPQESCLTVCNRFFHAFDGRGLNFLRPFCDL